MEWWKICCLMIVGTACAVIFMMLTADNPSADDFWRGIGSFGMGAGSAILGRKFLN